MKNDTKVTSAGSCTFSSASKEEKKKSIYEVITERFIDELNKGNIPWQKPWIVLNSETRYGAWSHDARLDGAPYSLLNQMLLPKEGEYVTFKQASAEGGKIKKGAKSYPLFYWKSYEVEQEDPKTHKMKKVRIPVLKYYRVFHIDDTEGIKQNFFKDENPMDSLKEPAKCKEAEKILKGYTEREGVELSHKAQDAAFYSPLTDSITLPLKKQFKDKSEYYSTVFHEVAHSTGAESRCNRFGNGIMDTRPYALEELVAEISASVMLKKLGLETEKSHKNNTAYIQSWLKALSDDNRMIVKAASRAQKAVNCIYGIKPSYQTEEQ